MQMLRQNLKESLKSQDNYAAGLEETNHDSQVLIDPADFNLPPSTYYSQDARANNAQQQQSFVTSSFSGQNKQPKK